MKDLIKDHTYLIKFGCQFKLYNITILLITKTAYHVRWNNGLESTDNWNEINKFDELYSLVEDITDFVTETQTSARILCPYCLGAGAIRDDNSSSGTKVCPHCWGTKRVSA